jgi:hypothetical protein
MIQAVYRWRGVQTRVDIKQGHRTHTLHPCVQRRLRLIRLSVLCQAGLSSSIDLLKSLCHGQDGWFPAADLLRSPKAVVASQP